MFIVLFVVLDRPEADSNNSTIIELFVNQAEYNDVNYYHKTSVKARVAPAFCIRRSDRSNISSLNS